MPLTKKGAVQTAPFLIPEANYPRRKPEQRNITKFLPIGFLQNN